MDVPASNLREHPLVARIAAEQLRQIAAGAALAAVLGPIWSSLIAFLLYSGFFPELGVIPLSTAISHAGMISAWSLAAGAFVVTIRKHRSLESESCSWLFTAKVFLLTGAVTWSACLLMLWAPSNPLNHLFVGTLFYATALAFIGCYPSHWRIYVSLQVVTLLILVGHALIERSTFDLVIVILALAFLVTSLYCGWLVHKHIADALRLRFRNESLAAELAQARDEALEQRKEAVTANRAKSAFLANMSHELRTPLNAVIGFAEIIRSQLLGPIGSARYLEYAGDIHASGTHLLSLINDILDLAKIEAGRIEIEPQRIDTEHAVMEVVRLTRVRAEQKRHSVTSAIAQDCPHTFADARALTQILLNLIGNAIKFTPEGGEIAIRAAALGAFVEFTISDTGPGISPENLERVFKPFEQLDNRYATSEGGTGLGLALVKGLVNLHGGSCSIDSALGRGTTARVYLPAWRAADAKAVA